MTFTYSEEMTTQKDVVRFLLQDTDPEESYVSDEAINYSIGVWFPIYGTLQYVAATIADTIAARYAREVSYSADGVSIGLGAVGEQFRQLAAALREQHKSLLVGGFPDVGGITPGEQTDPDIAPLSFGTGMHDDIEAGRQDYGSRDQYYPIEPYPGI